MNDRRFHGFGAHALLHQEVEAIGTHVRNGQLQEVAPDIPDDGRAVQVLVRELACHDAERLDANFLEKGYILVQIALSPFVLRSNWRSPNCLSATPLTNGNEKPWSCR